MVDPSWRVYASDGREAFTTLPEGSPEPLESDEYVQIYWVAEY